MAGDSPDAAVSCVQAVRRGSDGEPAAKIKPSDPMIVGMFPKYSDKVAENTALVRKILAG